MSESPNRIDLTNDSFAATDRHFIAMCERAGVAATKRQASKYRRKLGSAYRAHQTWIHEQPQQEAK